MRLFIFLHFWLGFLLCQSWGGENFKVSGNANLGASYRQQGVVVGEEVGVVNDSQIYVRVQNIINRDLKIGALAKGEYVLRSNGTNLDPALDKAFMFVKSKNIGSFELGNVEAVNQKLKVGSYMVAKGAGGMRGKFLEHINLAGNSRFILLDQSPIGHAGQARSSVDYENFSYRNIKDNSFDGLEDASKISFISPRMNDFKVGISYTPDVQDQGVSHNSQFDYANNFDVKDVLSVGVNYLKYIDNVSFKISATSEYGNAKNQEDLFAYDTAFIVSYFGFDLGFSYGSWGKSLQEVENVRQCNHCSDPYYFTSGISYNIGPVGASITTFNSNYYDNKFRSISLDFDYKLTKDLMTYFEVTKFETSSNNYEDNSDSNNQGYVAMIGTLINF